MTLARKTFTCSNSAGRTLRLLSMMKTMSVGRVLHRPAAGRASEREGGGEEGGDCWIIYASTMKNDGAKLKKKTRTLKKETQRDVDEYVEHNPGV